MVAMMGGDEALTNCCFSAPKFLSMKVLSSHVPLALSPFGIRHGDGPTAGLQDEGVEDGSGCAALCRFGPGPAAGDFKIPVGCMKLIVPISSSSSFEVQQPGAWFVADLCGIDEEDDVHHLYILLGDTFEASSWRSIANFALKITAVLDTVQQLVATTSKHFLIPCVVAIMVVVQSSDSKLLGGSIEASAPYYQMASVQISGRAIHSIEQDLLTKCSSTGCNRLSGSGDYRVEDAVSKLFGLCHRRWTTTPPLLILRFNGRDTLSLSSVKAIRYLQLSSLPHEHIPDRPSGEPPAGHQLDCISTEALEDRRCGNFGSGLSTDGRTPYGSICDLWHLLCEFRSSSCCIVHLGTSLSCSTVESHVLMYQELHC